ncbi:MAG: cytochrome c [Chlorobi bacterium]|nr:cytochrome c [Chlorobiota bacterium]
MKKISLLLKTTTLIFATISVFASCGNNNSSNDNSPGKTENKNKTEKLTPANYAAGKKIYENKCTVCHQENGEGIPPSFPSLRNKSVSVNTIVNGKPGTAMIAFKDQLSDKQLYFLINYINHTFGKDTTYITEEDINAVK